MWILPLRGHAVFGPWWDRGGALLWGSLFVVITVISVVAPEYRTVIPNYVHGSEAFFAHRPLYDLGSLHGFLYSPAFAVFFAPFWLLGPMLGNTLWKVVSLATLTYAVHEQLRFVPGPRRVWSFSCSVLIALPLVSGTALNGQATMLLLATSWLAVLAAARGRKLHLFLWMSLALIVKPTAIVPLVLIGGIYPRQLPVLLAAVAAVLFLPFPFAPNDYVAGQTIQFGELLVFTSSSNLEHFIASDFTAMFARLGIPLSEDMAFAIRVIAALVVYGLALECRQHLDGRPMALALIVLATFYMSLFNPRVEGNTYALLALPFAVAIAVFMQDARTRTVAFVLGVVLFMSGFDSVSRPILRLTEYWFMPTVSTLVFTGLLLCAGVLSSHVAEDATSPMQA